ncbi:MAG: glycine cleavage system aminomethyltransferase GcvT [Candidatus Gastranaerophilales bacterium]|nr:glycine cleavage system aminomethyltransferase GcvT [Candidatus Gastranaerophilales bacterium]
MDSLKRTPIYEEHVKSGAKIVPFAGWEMPLQYCSIIDEHLTVRNKVGLFDVSHMGEIFVKGREALDFLQKLVPQDISKLFPGKAVYCQLINKTAGIIDDLIIYRLEDSEGYSSYLLIVNASRIEEDFDWIEFNRKDGSYDVEIDNQSDNIALLSVQGPYSSDLIQDMGFQKVDQPVKFTIKSACLDSFDVLISRTGYTGEDGFEILIKNENAVKLWQEILAKGQKYEIKPVGLAARDTLRLEASMLLYGQDMDDKITPPEASLSWSIPADKEEDYFGKEIILSQLKNKNMSKNLVGLRMIGTAIPRHNYEIFKDNEKVGVVTSGGIAPALKFNIGLGYVNANVSTSIGTKLDIKIRDKFFPAEIVKRPFYVRSMRK